MDEVSFQLLQDRYDELQTYKQTVRRQVRDEYREIIQQEIEYRVLQREEAFARELVKARRNGAKRQDLARVLRTNANPIWQRMMELGGWDRSRWRPVLPKSKYFEVIRGMEFPIRIKALAVPGWGELREGDVEFTLRARKHVRTSGRVDKRWDFDPKAFDFDDTPEFEKAWGANFAEAVAELQEFGWSLGVDWDDYYEKQGGDESVGE